MKDNKLPEEWYKELNTWISCLARKYPLDMYDDMMQEAYLGIRTVYRRGNPTKTRIKYGIREAMQGHYGKMGRQISLSRTQYRKAFDNMQAFSFQTLEDQEVEFSERYHAGPERIFELMSELRKK